MTNLDRIKLLLEAELHHDCSSHDSYIKQAIKNIECASGKETEKINR